MLWRVDDGDDLLHCRYTGTQWAERVPIRQSGPVVGENGPLDEELLNVSLYFFVWLFLSGRDETRRTLQEPMRDATSWSKCHCEDGRRRVHTKSERGTLPLSNLPNTQRETIKKEKRRRPSRPRNDTTKLHLLRHGTHQSGRDFGKGKG